MPRKITDYVPRWGEEERPPAKPAGPLPPSDPDYSKYADQWGSSSPAARVTGFPSRDATDPKLKLRRVLRFPAEQPRFKHVPGEGPFAGDRDLRRELPSRAGRFQPHGTPPEYMKGAPGMSMKRAECVKCGRRTDPENLNYAHVCIDCQRTQESLRRDSLGEGLSVNGSMGLGGISAQGFDVQNGGVTKRRPGEGAKDNGGRAQSQEMDSYDQPQYMGFPQSRRFDIMRAEGTLHESEEEVEEAREVKPGFFVYTPGEEPPPVEPDESDHNRGMDPSYKQPSAMDLIRKMHPEWFENEPGKTWTNPAASDERYGPTGQIPTLRRQHPKIDPSRESGIGGEDFTKDNPQIIDLLGGDTKAEGKDIERASEEEHEEHPWLTKGQAKRIARDHQRVGKDECKLSRVYRVRK